MMPYDEISVPLSHDSERHWPPTRAEILFATPLSDGSYRVENVPFYASDLALGDIVEVSRTTPIPVIKNVRQHSGASTLRVMSEEGNEAVISSLSDALRSKGCVTESHSQLPLLAISVPPHVDITVVYDLLSEGFSNGRCDYEVGFDFVAHCSRARRREILSPTRNK